MNLYGSICLKRGRSASSRPEKCIVDLSRFTFKLDTEQNKWMMRLISCHSYKVALVIDSTSTTKKRWRIFVNLVTLIPVNEPSLRLDFSSMLKLSITRMKSKGESGHSRRRPLPILKKLVASPLTMTARDTELTHSRIQLVNWVPNPTWIKISLRKS